MKKLLAVIALLASLTFAQATVVIYVHSYTETVTGNGYTTSTNFIGYTVMSDEGLIGTLDAWSRGGKFVSWSVSDSFDLWTLNHSLLGTSDLIGYVGDIGATFMKGKNVIQDVGFGKVPGFVAPKSMTLGGSYYRDGLFHEFKGTLTVSGLTKTANLANYDTEATAEWLLGKLNAKGYVTVL